MKTRVCDAGSPKEGNKGTIMPLKMPFEGFFMPYAMRAVIDFYDPYPGGII